MELSKTENISFFAGLNPTNKKPDNFLFSGKILCFLQIPANFSNYVPVKNLQKKVEISPASSFKN
jgi:hypothetical protein